MDGLVRGDGGIAQPQGGAEGSRRVLAVLQLQVAQTAIVEPRMCFSRLPPFTPMRMGMFLR